MRRRRTSAGVVLAALLFTAVLILIAGGGARRLGPRRLRPVAAQALAVTPHVMTEIGAPARALAVADGRVYAAGIGWYGTTTGAGLLVHGVQRPAITATPDQFDGQISDIAPDGHGGAYVGGDFRHVGAAYRPFLAHLLPDGTLDPRFQPHASLFVDAVRVANGRVYAGGQDGVSVYSASTGALLRHFAFAVPWVTELAVTRTTLYVGSLAPGVEVGTSLAASGAVISPVRPTLRVRLALHAIDLQTGVPLAGFDPPVVSSQQAQVSAIRSFDGQLWVGVDAVDGGQGLMRLNPRTGQGQPVGSVRGQVDEIVPLSRGRLLLTGAVAPASSAPATAAAPRPLRSRGAVVIDPASLRLDRRFDCDLPGNPTDGLAGYDAVLRHGRLWIAGEQAYTPGRDSGVITGLLAAVDPRTCRTERVFTPDQQVNALAPLGPGLLVGGQFTVGRPHPAPKAVFSARTGRPLGPVTGLPAGTQAMLDTPSGLWAAGLTALVEIDPRTGAVLHGLRLSPAPGGGQGDAQYQAVSLATAGGRIFVLRRGVMLAAQPTIEAVDAATGQQVPFTMPLPAVGGYPFEVRDILGLGDALYLAGSFHRTRRDGRPANIAVVRTDPTGRIDSAFDPHVDGPVQALATDGRRLFLDGIFASPRDALIAVDPATGGLDPRFDVGLLARRGALANTMLSTIGSTLLVRDFFTGVVDRAFGMATGRAVRVRVPGVPVLEQAVPVGDGQWFVTGAQPTKPLAMTSASAISPDW